MSYTTSKRSCIFHLKTCKIGKKIKDPQVTHGNGDKEVGGKCCINKAQRKKRVAKKKPAKKNTTPRKTRVVKKVKQIEIPISSSSEEFLSESSSDGDEYDTQQQASPYGYGYYQSGPPFHQNYQGGPPFHQNVGQFVQQPGYQQSYGHYHHAPPSPRHWVPQQPSMYAPMPDPQYVNNAADMNASQNPTGLFGRKGAKVFHRPQCRYVKKAAATGKPMQELCFTTLKGKHQCSTCR